MKHEGLVSFLAGTTIGAQLFSILLAAVPALVAGIFNYFQMRSARRKKEEFHRFVEFEAEDHRKHKQRDEQGKHSHSGDHHRSRVD